MNLTAVFVAAIFVGSVWLGKITLPLSVLAIPLFFVGRRQLNLYFPPAVFPLLAIGSIIIIQFALNFRDPAFKWKADLTTWLPLVFAGATIIALRYGHLGDREAARAMLVGGALTSAIMVSMIILAPKGTFLIPGQDAARVEDAYSKQRMREAAEGVDQPAGRDAFIPASAERDTAFYDVKNRARNMLGVSNYIAVFLVFLFAVALFSSLPWIAVAFAALTTLTLARFGMIILAIILCVYLLRQKIEPVKAAASSAVLIGVGLLGVYLIQNHFPHVPGAASILARVAYWRSGIEALSLHPPIGAPRSVFLVELGNNITWNPHNSILWVAVNFGFVGLVAYCVYVWIVMREIAKAAAVSDMWKGIFVGIVLILAWSLEEIIALTPAFELLLAALYSLARNRNGLAPSPHAKSS